MRLKPKDFEGTLSLGVRKLLLELYNGPREVQLIGPNEVLGVILSGPNEDLGVILLELEYESLEVLKFILLVILSISELTSELAFRTCLRS